MRRWPGNPWGYLPAHPIFINQGTEPFPTLEPHYWAAELGFGVGLMVIANTGTPEVACPVTQLPC